MRALLLIAMAAAAALRASTFYLTVAGLGGTPEYEQQFTNWAREIAQRVHEVDPTAEVITLDGPAATRAAVQIAFSQVARQAKPDDYFVVMLIGHGSFDGSEYKMNVPGPDITAADLAAWMNRVPAARQLIVNMTSASGASVAALEHPRRVVIAATKTGNEKNVTVFPRYWVDALRDASADSDKNGIVSAQEAFRYAGAKTAKFYETEKRLSTEHAQMLGQDGPFPLLALQPRVAAPGDPAKAKLVAYKQDLETKIDELKQNKAAMEEDDYKKHLTVLLLDLARTQAEIDK